MKNLSWTAFVLAMLIIRVAMGDDAATRRELKANSAKEHGVGNLDTALQMIKKAAAISQKLYGEKSADHAEDLDELASIQLDQNDLPACIESTRKVLAIRQEIDAKKPWLVNRVKEQLRYYERVKTMTEADHQRLQAAAEDFAEAKRQENLGYVDKAIELANQAIANRRAVVGYVNLAIAEDMAQQAFRLGRAQRTSEAEKLFTEALAAVDQLLGPVSRIRAAYVQAQAFLYRDSDIDRCLELQQVAVKNFEEVLGPAHPAVLQSRKILATIYGEKAQALIDARKLGEASKFFKQKAEMLQLAGQPRWEVREAQALSMSWQRFDSLDAAKHMQVSENTDRFENAKAEQLPQLIQAIEFFDETFGKDCDASLTGLNKIAGLTLQWNLPETVTRDACDRAITRMIEVRGTDYPKLLEFVDEYTDELLERGRAYESDRKFEAALQEYTRTAQLLSRHFGRDYYATRSVQADAKRMQALQTASNADCDAILGSFKRLSEAGAARLKEDVSVALEVARRILADRSRILGQNARETAFCWYSIGSLLERQSKFSDAEEAYRQALKSYRLSVGDKHPDCAMVWKNLGTLYKLASRMDQSKAAHARAKEIYAEAYGRDNPDYASQSVALATIAAYQRDGNEIERQLEGVFDVLENAGPGYQDDLGRAYAALAGWHEHLNASDAEVLLNNALTAFTAAGSEFDCAIIHDNIGSMLRRQKRYREAEPHSMEAVRILSKIRSPGDSTRIQANLNRAFLLESLDRRPEAIEVLEASIDGAYHLFEQSALGTSERDAFAALTDQRNLLDAYVTLAIGHQVDSAKIYQRVSQWKGAVFGRQRADRAFRLAPNVQESLNAARQAIGNLTQLCMTPPSSNSDEALDWRNAVRQAAAARDDAERELGLSIKQQRQNEPAGTNLKSGQSAWELPVLPEKCVTIDFFQYQNLISQGASSKLVAFVASPDRSISIVDLDCDEVTAQIDAWRQSHSLKTPIGNAREVEQKLFACLTQPLLLPLTKHDMILVSPDGPLTRFPLSALPLANGSPIIQSKLVVTVPNLSEIAPENVLSDWLASFKLSSLQSDKSSATSVRSSRTAGGNMLLVASLDYGKPSTKGFSFDPLPFSELELNEIGTLAEKQNWKVQRFRGLAANESTLRAAFPGKQILHLATHGFIVPDVQRKELMRADIDIDRRIARGIAGDVSEWRAASLLGHGTLSGLALSNSNQSAGKAVGDDDNRLTEAEVALWDLRQTQLAVLSACDSAMGDATESQAVLGLQRAFHIAGAESVVATLWKVNDQATARLMSNFYRHAWNEGLPYPVALRAAQLDIIRDPTQGGKNREPDFASAKSKSSSVAEKVARHENGNDSTQLWAAFTISVCRSETAQAVKP